MSDEIFGSDAQRALLRRGRALAEVLAPTGATAITAAPWA